MRVMVMIYIAVVPVLLSASAFGTVVIAPGGDTDRAAVLNTGQSACYDVADDTGFPASPAVIPCAGTGRDGELRRGVAWPNPRFTDLGDGTVRDNMAGPFILVRVP